MKYHIFKAWKIVDFSWEINVVEGYAFPVVLLYHPIIGWYNPHKNIFPKDLKLWQLSDLQKKSFSPTETLFKSREDIC